MIWWKYYSCYPYIARKGGEPETQTSDPPISDQHSSQLFILKETVQIRAICVRFPMNCVRRVSYAHHTFRSLRTVPGSPSFSASPRNVFGSRTMTGDGVKAKPCEHFMKFFTPRLFISSQSGISEMRASRLRAERDPHLCPTWSLDVIFPVVNAADRGNRTVTAHIMVNGKSVF
jgi:hypothetical protein